MNSRKHHIFQSILTLLAVVLVSSHCHAQFYNGSEQEFGKNRVQYKSFDWLYYPGESLDVYFYKGGKDLAEYTTEYGEIALKEVQELLDYSLTERAQIIVYNSQTDFRQSNVGIVESSQENVGGKIPIIGSKIFVYFDGNHENLALQIKENLARIIIRQMMFGGNWKTVLRSSAFMHMPDWYIEGLVSYAGTEWSSEKAKFIRDGIQSGDYTSFNTLTGIHEKYAGHAFWKFIGEVYGKNVIPNILYMNKISRNIEDGFLFVLGKNMENIFGEYQEFWIKKIKLEDSKYPEIELNRLYSDQQLEKIEAWKTVDAEKLAAIEAAFNLASSNPDSKKYLKLKALIENWEILGYEGKKWRKLDKKFEKYLGAIPVKSKKKYSYSQFNRSPDGDYLSFVTHEYGQYKIWLYHIASGKLKRVIKRESKIDRIQDETYPNTVWHPSGETLAFISEKKGRVFINFYSLTERKTETKELFRIDKVLDMTYSTDGKKMVFSGVAQGQTDLYQYSVIGNNQTRLTNDVYDDLDPEFIPGTESIIFSSNRPDDTLRVDVPVGMHSNFKDIYILHTANGVKSLEQVTRTENYTEEEPQALSNKFFSYVSYKDGFKNQYVASVDSVISRIDTTIHYRYFTNVNQLSDYAEQLENYQINPKLRTYGYTFYDNGSQRYNWGNIGERGEISTSGLERTSESENTPNLKFKDFQTEKVSNAKKDIDPQNYRFEDENKDYNYDKEIVRIGDFKDEEELDSLKNKEFELPKSRNYRLNFTLDELTTQVDNSLNFEMYRSLSSSFNINQGLGLGGMAKGSDLFEDYKVKGIARINFNRTNNDIGLIFSDLSSRLDKHYSLMRYKRQEFVEPINGFSEISHFLARTKLVYPINELYSIRSTFMVALEENVTYATDNFTSGVKTARDYLAGGRFSFVFDNTRNKGFNILEGTRYKVFSEIYYFNGTQANLDFYSGIDTKSSGNLNTIGLDFRHYENIYRDFTIAIRAAGVTSFGDRLLLNALGGVDNELFGRVADPQPTISASDGFAYYSQPTQIRGFRQISRVGSNFGLVNIEARWPVIRFFSKQPLNSEFAQTFQLVGFYDIASAWVGRDPYSDDNDYNFLTFEGNPITVSIRNNREPIIWSYGFGARAKVMGYFVRADIGLGVDDGFLQKPVLHLTFVQDF